MRVIAPARLRKSSAAGRVWSSLGKSAGTRLLVLPISAILGIFCTRLIIDNYGAAAYAQYGLLLGIVSLLPFADLGLGAAIMNSVGASDDPRRDAELRRVLITAVRLLLVSAAALLLVSLLLLVLGVWPAVLGAGLLPGSGPVVAALCLVVIGVTLPFGLGQRILVGLGKNHISIALMGLQTPIVLITLAALIWGRVSAGPWVALIPYLATMCLTLVTVIVAARRINPTFRLALKDVPRKRTRGGRVSHLAWPMLIQMIALPIAMQTDRIILSHIAPIRELATYNLAAQMFTPLWHVASAAGLALWPIFARQRAISESKTGAPSPHRLAVFFGLVAAAGVTVIGLAAPWLASVASNGAIRLPVPLIVWFGVLIIVQCVKVPLGMYLTDAAGLRFQAWFILAMLPINFGLSWALAHPLGATGPVIGSAVGVVLCQVVPTWIQVRRRVRRGDLNSENAS